MGSSDSDANYGAYIKPDFGGSNSSLTLGVRDAGVDTDVLKFISGKIGIHASPDAFARVTIGGSIAKMLFSSSVAGNSIVINSPSSTYLFGLQVTGAGGLARLSLGRTTSASNAFSNEDLTVYDNGDIGINKTVPVSDLDVAGHINAFNITGLQLYGSSTGQNVTGYDIRALKTLYISGQTVVTGDIYNKLYQTGVNLMALITAASTGVSAINGVSGLVSIVGTGDIYVTTNGQVITVSGNSGNFATRTELFNTGSNIYNLINTTTGYLNTNPSGFITTGQTGQFYPASNPNDYATTLFVNSQDNVVSLKVDSLSGYDDKFSVHRRGTESITGDKSFIDAVRVSGHSVITGNYYMPTQAYTTNGTIDIDWNRGNVFKYTLNGNITFTFSNNKDGQTIVIAVTNLGSDAYTATWPSTVHWPSNTAPTQSTASKLDVYTAICISTGIYMNAVQAFSN
jgi:hypothetical protein